MDNAERLNNPLKKIRKKREQILIMLLDEYIKRIRANNPTLTKQDCINILNQDITDCIALAKEHSNKNN